MTAPALPSGVRAVGRVFAPEFEKLGFTTRWVDGAEWGRAGHLIAERRGNGRGPKLVFIGHLDTVFEHDSPFQADLRTLPMQAKRIAVVLMRLVAAPRP